MPKDTVERAIRRGSGEDGGENYAEVRYESGRPAEAGPTAAMWRPIQMG